MALDHEEPGFEQIQAELAVAEVKHRARLLARTRRRWPRGTELLSLGSAAVFFIVAFRVYDRLPSTDLKDVWLAAMMLAFGFSLLSQIQVQMLADRVDALVDLAEALQPPASRTH